MDQHTYVVAVTNYGISIVCILLLNYTKEIQIWLSTYSTKQVSTLLNGCVGHAVRIYLKNKVPPRAIVNGMQFPLKPAFFELNELECRLLAPRLAFQKLMQAPRGDN